MPYHTAVLGLLVLAGLIVIQLLVADLAGMRARHVPGMPVTDGHGSFFFRATRAHANTNENLGLFLLLVLICIFAAASPKWTGIWVGLFTAARAAHMIFYYADLRLPRSAAFGIGVLAQLGLLVTAALVLL